MGKIKDIIYDISDIITAFTIVSIAGIVIFFSIGNIMDYPNLFKQAQSQENQNFGLAVPVDDGTNTDTDINSPASNQTSGSAQQPEEVTNYAVYINYGESINSIAEKFVAVGLFQSVEEFNKYLSAVNGASKIKAGNFVIPSNAAPEQVIAQITN